MSEFVILLSGAGAILFINGVSFRLATPMWAKWVEKYNQGALTGTQRRGPVVNAPLGIGLLVVSLALAIDSQPWTGAFWTLGALCGVLVVGLSIHPPSWALPVWMHSRDLAVFRDDPPLWRSNRVIWLGAISVAMAMIVLLIIVDKNNIDRVIWLLMLAFGAAVAAGARARRRAVDDHSKGR